MIYKTKLIQSPAISGINPVKKNTADFLPSI